MAAITALLVAALVISVMWSVKVGAALVGLGVAIVAVRVWERQTSKSRRRTLQGRPDLTIDQIFECYYASTDVGLSVVREAFRDISETLDVPAGKLRPSDRFDVELGPTVGWEYDDVVNDLVAHATQRLDALHDSTPVRTVDDYVRLTASSTRGQA